MERESLTNIGTLGKSNREIIREELAKARAELVRLERHPGDPVELIAQTKGEIFAYERVLKVLRD